MVILQVEVGADGINLGEVETLVDGSGRGVVGHVVGDVVAIVGGGGGVAIEAVGEVVRHAGELGMRGELQVGFEEVLAVVADLLDLAQLGNRQLGVVAGLVAVDVAVLRRRGELPVHRVEPRGVDLPGVLERQPGARHVEITDVGSALVVVAGIGGV
jgi:hypothetical protein